MNEDGRARTMRDAQPGGRGAADWPEWLEPLRPDDMERSRIRRGVMRTAGPLLAARRPSWWDEVARWADVLAPIAAVFVLFCAGLAFETARPGTEAQASAEAPVVDLVQPPAPAGPPELLTAAREPSNDRILRAAVLEASASGGRR